MIEFIKLYLQIIACTMTLGTLSYHCLAEDVPHKDLPMEFTEEQRNCLEDKLGKPGEGELPSHEEMRAAASACDLPPPPDKPRHREYSESNDE